MKLCWDNLDKLRYSHRTSKFYRYKSGHGYTLVDSCLFCGDPYLSYRNGRGRTQREGDFCSKSCARQGEFNSSWKGGVSTNIEYIRKWNREYYLKSNKYQKQKESYYRNSVERRARKFNQTPLNINKQRTKQIYNLCHRLNSGVPWTPFHVDHVVPLSKGGLHHEDNLRIIPAFLNRVKGSKILGTRKGECSNGNY